MKKKHTIILLSALAAAVGADEPKKPIDIFAERLSPAVVPYKTIDDVTLNMHIFEPERADQSDVRPALILFHGGGWRWGRPQNFYPQADYFSKKGMVVLTPEYRLMGVHGTTALECVKDARSAVRWVREHAADWGIDPNRIAVGGGSAGGHMALCTELSESVNEESDLLKTSARPDLMILYFPVVSTMIERRIKSFPEGFDVESVSPLHCVRSNMPPTLIMVGALDYGAPADEDLQLQRRMSKTGSDCKLIIYPRAAHGFSTYGDGDNDGFYSTCRDAERWLTDQGWLPVNH